VEHYVSHIPNAQAVELLTCILHALRGRLASSGSQLEVNAKIRLRQLVSLRSAVGYQPVIDETIAVAVTANVPIGLGDQPSDCLESHNLASLISHAGTRWRRRNEAKFDELPLPTFMGPQSWTISTVRIISVLFYQQSFPRDIFLQHLPSAKHSLSYLASVLHAFLDFSVTRGTITTDSEAEALALHFPRLLAAIFEPASTYELRSLCTSCVVLMVKLVPSKQHYFLGLIGSQIQSLSVVVLNPQIIGMANYLRAILKEKFTEFTDLLVEHGLQWVIRYFADADQDIKEAKRILMELSTILGNHLTVSFMVDLNLLSATLVEASSNVKSHLVETVLTVAVKHYLGNLAVSNFLCVLIQKSQLKVSPT
jgi:hypothetical protein